ncbi:MAG: hypothetical protein IJS58_02675 [Bacilli bacterium]|nr:hypothetical protein [Bacilli bacterium]
MKGKSSLFSGKYRNYAVGNISFMGKGNHAAFAKYVENRSDIDPNGMFDVIAHGTWNKIEVVSSGKSTLIDARQASRLIKSKPGSKHVKAVRLLSCCTGSNPEGFAQHLANALGKPVYAPNVDVYAIPSGKHWLGNTKEGLRGEYIEFKPGGIKHGKKKI